MYLANVFICPFLDHTQCSNYYWYGGSFNVPHYFNFNSNFQITVVIDVLSLYLLMLLLTSFSLESGGCPRGVMVKVMDCRIVVSEFVLQSRYYVHFQANTLGKGMNPLILPVIG